MAGDLGRRIRAHRLQRGWSQAHLAERAGLATKFLERAESERGSFNPKFSTLIALAGAFGLSVVELIGDASPPKPKRTRPLGKNQKRLCEIAATLASREARLLVQVADYMLHGD